MENEKTTTVVTYKLEHDHLEKLQVLAKKTISLDRFSKPGTVKLCEIETVGQVLNSGACLAFINMDGVSIGSQDEFYRQWQVASDGGAAPQALTPVKLPLTYLENYQGTFQAVLPNLRLNMGIFTSAEKLRMAFLQQSKNKPANENSLRLRRVLLIYECLLCHGRVNKEVVRVICRQQQLPEISDRTFHRDMQVIKEINLSVYYCYEKHEYRMRNMQSIK